jgi:hypothetical protein
MRNTDITTADIEVDRNETLDCVFDLSPMDAMNVLRAAPRDKGNPEHYFYGFWLTRLKEGQTVSREDWQLILTFPEWLDGPIGSLVKELCVRDRLFPDEAEWLASVLPQESFAWQQLAALLLLGREKSWGIKLEETIRLNAYWAAERVIATAPEAELAGFGPIIERSRQKKRLRSALAERVLPPTRSSRRRSEL